MTDNEFMESTDAAGKQIQAHIDCAKKCVNNQDAKLDNQYYTRAFVDWTNSPSYPVLLQHMWTGSNFLQVDKQAPPPWVGCRGGFPRQGPGDGGGLGSLGIGEGEGH